MPINSINIKKGTLINWSKEAKEKFDESEYNQIIAEYNAIIKLWKKEWMKDANNTPQYYE